MARRKDVNWSIGDGSVSTGDAQLAVLMDIRDELKSINTKLGCYRIPRALDALRDMGVEARAKRKTRLRRNRRARA